MNLEQHKDKMITGVIVLVILSVFSLFFTKVMVPKIKNDIKKDLRQPYGPSPFGPSINQDTAKQTPFVLQPHHEGYDPSKLNTQYETIQKPTLMTTQSYNSWVKNWEKERLTPQQ